MSRILSELLGVSEPLFARELERLELSTGNPSIDVRLTAEIIGKGQMKTRELGLDPRDSKGVEIYHALLNLADLHDGFLSKKIGIEPDADLMTRLAKIRDAALKVDIPRSTWAIKASAMKRILKNNPPKRVMKHLGYKSLDSILKRESPSEILAGARLLENDAWHKALRKSYHELTSNDFETRQIEVRLLGQKRWSKPSADFAKNHGHNILSINELGAVLLLPAEFNKQNGLTITLLPMLLHSIQEVRSLSAFFKLHQLHGDFGAKVAELLHDGDLLYLSLAGQKLHWRVVQRHFGRHPNQHPEVLEPHVQPGDLGWQKTEKTLYEIEPALHFWHDMDFVAGLPQGDQLSFNLLDTAISLLNGLNYEDRLQHHFRNSLWNELFIRYLAQPALEAQVINQLDYEETAPELIAMLRRRT